VAPAVVEQVATEQQNTLTTFVSLLVKEEKAQAETKEKEKEKKDEKSGGDKKDEKKNKDPIVTDTSCKP
jgi:hypothetical protein